MASTHETEWEMELEDELEGVMESEFEHHEGGAHELEDEFEHHEAAHEFEAEQHELESLEHHEFEDEFETGEQFFGRIARGIGRFARRAAPLLRSVARIAAPMVGTAIGGPFGAILGRVASQALGEEELEQHELAHEFEQHESAHEFEQHEFEHPELAHE